MARAYILGHGARVPGREKTHVPAGKSISFYAEVDKNALIANGLAALNAGDIPPVETFIAGSYVDNYRLSSFSDSEIAAFMAAESSLTGGRTYFVGMDRLGSPIALCSTPPDCRAFKPGHSPWCEGLLALVPEAELFCVSCRGVLGQKNTFTRRLGAPKLDREGHDASEDFDDETRAKAQELLALGKKDPAAAIAQLESFSEPTRQMLFANYAGLRSFVEDYYRKTPQSAFDLTQKQMAALPSLFSRKRGATPEAVLEARRALEALGEVSFAEHVDKYGAERRQMVLAEPDLRAAYERGLRDRPGPGRKPDFLTSAALEREVIEQQKAMREKARPLVDDMEKRRLKKKEPGDRRPEIEAEAEPRSESSQELGWKEERSARGHRRSRPLIGQERIKIQGPKEEVDPAIKLVDLSKEQTPDPYRKVAIALMTKRISDGDGPGHA